MKRPFRFALTAAPLLLASLARGEGKPHFDAATLTAHAAAPRVRPRAGAPFVASIDAHRGAPTFIWGAAGAPAPAAAGPEDAARAHLADHAAHYGLAPEALATARVVAVHDTGRGGVLVTFRQRLGEVEVYRNDVHVLMSRDLRLVAMGGNLHPSAVASPKTAPFRLRDADAVARALADLYDAPVGENDLARGPSLPGGYRSFGLSPARPLGLALERPARVKRVYYPLPGRLVPAYFLELSSRRGAGSPDAYAYVIAADDGRLLYRDNLTHAVSFGYRLWADPAGDHRPMDGPLADYTPYPAAAPDGSFPPFAAPSLIEIDGFNKTHDPWLPEGATVSTGNNVDAYTDDGTPEGFSPGDVRATATSPGVFDHAFDVNAGAQSSTEQKMASVTSIFYVTNWLHDWWYDSGFDEKGGNAQKSNLGRGGIEGDPLLAEAQFQAPKSRNNSNMAVFADGSSPAMHMFVWDGKVTASLALSPGASDLPIGLADFGPTSFSLSAGVALADDGTAPNDDACQPITNDVSGNVAVVVRGNCNFASKAAAAQTAGAVGVIVVDNISGEAPPAMGGGNGASTVTIPVVSVSASDGAALLSALAAGPLTATLARSQAPDLDGTIDNTVVAHEWGHYLHLRNVACGSAMCSAESEGWADFDALQMVVREGDDLDGAYALAQYATASFADDPAYFGIRRYPYSVDKSKNPLTFQDITSGQALPAGPPVSENAAQSDNAEAHAAGEVWASMVFEGFVALLKRSQGATPAYGFDEARRRMADYVVMGMKLAPVDPTYTEQRDAVLAAAVATDPTDADALAQAFARRGAGTCAASPARESTDFGDVVESFTVQPSVEIVSADVDDSVLSCDHDGHLDAGETGKLTVVLRNGSTTALSAATAELVTNSPGVTFPEGNTIAFTDLAPFGSQTMSVSVALDPSVSAPEHFDLKVSVGDAPSCGSAASLEVAPLVNYDDEPTGATVDSVEAKATTFTLDGDGADQVWSRLEASAGNHVWAGVDYPAPSDTALVTPALDVSKTEPLVLTFTHRYQFEASSGAYYDGAVVEISTDQGKTWQDAATLGKPGYNGTIGDPQNQATNVLKGRQGYVDHNPSYPQTDKVSIDLGTSLAGKTALVRFRIGTDDAEGAFGWELDDIGFTGITNAPFAEVVNDANTCGAHGGQGGQGGQGSSGANANDGTAGNQSKGQGGTHGGAGSAAKAAGGAAMHPITRPSSANGTAPDASDVEGSGCSVKKGPSPFGGALAALAMAAAAWRRRRSRTRSTR